jgi:hypothetical protein
LQLLWCQLLPHCSLLSWCALWIHRLKWEVINWLAGLGVHCNGVLIERNQMHR